MNRAFGTKLQATGEIGLFVNIATVADADNEHDKLLILDPVYDPVIPHAGAPQI